MNESYYVSGMTCDGCVKAVTRAITRRAPAAAVSVDLAKGRITVTGDVAASTIANAVTEAGFTFAGVAG